jgi:hypothetical protein
MSMSQLFIVPTNENGLILDTQIAADINTALSPPFAYNDVYVYAHGWWTSPQRAMQDYNQFTVGYARSVLTALAAAAGAPAPRGALGIGVQWPSMIFNSDSLVADAMEAATFYEMETRADSIGANAGYALLRCVLQKAPPLQKINLIGHSFGCKVVCKLLEELYHDRATVAVPAATQLNVVLLQAAFDNDDLEANNIYGNLAAGFPNLRMLVTTSQLDEALGDLYPKAERLNLFKLLGDPRVALGYGAPTAAVQAQFGPVARISVDPGFTGVGLPPSAAARMWIADLTPLHSDPTSAPFNMPLVGHHTDIFRDEIYSLIAGFIG